MRARVIRGSKEGERWTAPALDAADFVASAVVESFRRNCDVHDDPVVESKTEFIQGREEGFAQGLQEGKQQAMSLMQEQLRTLSQITAYAREPLALIDERIDDELVRLVICIARQVIRREVSINPEQTVAVVREARAVLSDVQGNLTIALHPDEAAFVREIFSGDESLSGVVVEEDPSITRGGCTLNTEISFVDAKIESRIAQVAVELLGDERGTNTRPAKAESQQ